MGSDEERYAKARADRRAKVDAVLQSKSQKKIVVAGPGTGKTFLFKEILKDKKNSLALSFVNSLVEDLSLELCGLSEVKMDSLTLLAEDPKCNLGWRIAAKRFLADGDFKVLLAKAHGGEGNSFYELVDSTVREKINLMLAAFKKVAKGQTANPEQFAQLLHELGLDPQVLAHEMMRTKIGAYAGPKGSDPATRNISIKITTIPSSKGLAEDYVFIADFDDRFFLEKEQKCSDQKIFDFLVALTRARRKVFLISAEPKVPKFLTWIAKGRIEKTKL